MQVHEGFLLTRETNELKQSTQLIFWVKTRDGIAKLIVDDVVSNFFLNQQSVDAACDLLHQARIPFQMKSLSLMDFDSQLVTGFYFSRLNHYYSAARTLQQAGLDPLESDIRLADRFLMERFICGGVQFIGIPQIKSGFTEYRQVKLKASSFTPKLDTVSLDIECSEKGVLYSIGLCHDLDQRVIMVGTSSESSAKHDIQIEWVDSEYALLKALEAWFVRFDPDVILGWNVVDFDCRLLLARAKHHAIPLRLGRAMTQGVFRESQQTKQSFIDFPGRVVLDGIDGLKSATYSFSSWSLENVAQQLLKKGKSINHTHHKMAEINRMFREDKPALASYNLMDCQLVDEIFKRTDLLAFLVERTRLTGIELNRVGGSVAAFTNLYLPRLHRAGYVAPTLRSENWQASPGGFVMESQPGLYPSVLVLDYKSLYPSIIRTFFIDPLGLIEGLKSEEPSETVEGFKGGRFHREKNFLPEMITDLWHARDQAKQSGHQAFSQAIKIIMNSFYGVLGSSGCRFFDQRLASSITMRGHEIMKTTRQLIEAQGYEVIYGDTDSTFVSLGERLSNQNADKIGQRLVTEINHWWKVYLKDTYQIESFLELEYETHYATFLMPTIRGQETGSKKRYAGMVERDGKRCMVFKGLETVRTDWTMLAKNFQQGLYQRVFDGETVDQYINQVVQDTRGGLLDEQLVYRKRLRRTLGDYVKNVPPHVKAARKADEWYQSQGLPCQYQQGGWISYVITRGGPEPIEHQVHPFDYEHYIFKQLKPVADGILPFIGTNFEALLTPQRSLF